VASALRAAGEWDVSSRRDFDAEDWWYRCRFSGPAPAPGHHVFLGFAGLATLADVWLKEGLTTNFTPSDVRIEGTFKIEPFVGPTDGNTWSIYRLEDAQIR
jgi:beta-mannosidase